MKNFIIHAMLAAVAAAPAAFAQEPGGDFDRAAADVQSRLEASLARLAEVQRRVADETIPLSAELRGLEEELAALRQQYLGLAAEADQGKLDLAALRARAGKDQETAVYLGNLLGQYLREFEARLHVAELPLHAGAIAAARAAGEDASLASDESIRIQAAVLESSLDRFEAALNGASFPGAVIGPGGRQVQGAFLLAGPAALFRSTDGALVGTVEQRINSTEPSVLPFADPETAAAAGARVAGEGGAFVLDPSLGNAHRIEATEGETFLDEFAKGGPVMYPIFGMAGIALLIALFKWAGLAFVPKPSRSRLRVLLEAVRRGDQGAAREAARAIRGPAGRMLAAGVEHLREPRELIEEVMYEIVLQTKVRVQRLLPFVAICAASAPLLGLLGTVTGIMNTFRMITIYGSGDVKNLSGGISEALITTKYGLIVAIPALLLHAFLSRKARGVVGHMEGAAIAFVNEVSKSPSRGRAENGHAAAADAVRAQVGDVLRELLEPVLESESPAPRRSPAAQPS